MKKEMETNKLALVVPAFDLKNETLPFPVDRKEAMKLIHSQKMIPFQFNVFP